MKGETLQLNAALALFDDHLEEIKGALVDNMQSRIWSIEKPIDTGDDTLNWVRSEVYRLRVESATKGISRALRQIVGRQQYHNNTGSITDAQIALARERDITELFEELTGERVRHHMAKCPFHTDNTASLALGKYNRFTCFGCGEKGDTITLYMKIHGVGFIQAVRALI